VSIRESLFMPMALFMKVISPITFLQTTAAKYSIRLMYTKENLLMVVRMVRESIHMQLEDTMKEVGKEIKKMAME